MWGMHVDRSRFLLLTAALATAACNRGTAEPKTDEAKAAKDAKTLEDAKASEDTKAPAGDPSTVTKTDAPSTPGTATPPGGGGDKATAPAPSDENPPPSPVVESTANWD
jgi:hypothetical protein